MGNTAPFEEMLLRWQVVGNTVPDLTGPRFEHQTSRFRDERVTAQPTDRFIQYSASVQFSIPALIAPK